MRFVIARGLPSRGSREAAVGRPDSTGVSSQMCRTTGGVECRQVSPGCGTAGAGCGSLLRRERSSDTGSRPLCASFPLTTGRAKLPTNDGFQGWLPLPSVQAAEQSPLPSPSPAKKEFNYLWLCLRKLIVLLIGLFLGGTPLSWGEWLQAV